MTRHRKFKPGPVATVQEAVSAILAGRWLYWFDRPKHPSFLVSLQLRTVAYHAGRGDFRIAIPNEEPKHDE